MNDVLGIIIAGVVFVGIVWTNRYKKKTGKWPWKK